MATQKKTVTKKAAGKKAAPKRASAKKAPVRKKAAGKGEDVPVKRAVNPMEEVERLFGDLVGSRLFKPWNWEWPEHLPRPFGGQWPRMDIAEQEKEVVIKVEAPGVTKDDLEVNITDNAVLIRGKTSHEEKEENADYFRREISCGSFERTLALPQGVDASKAKASFENGILRVSLPKTRATKRRSVKVE